MTEWLLSLFSEHQKRVAQQSSLERLQWDHTTFLGTRTDLEVLVSSSYAAAGAAADAAGTTLDVLIPLEISDETVELAQATCTATTGGGGSGAGLDNRASAGPMGAPPLLEAAAGVDDGPATVAVQRQQQQQQLAAAARLTSVRRPKLRLVLFYEPGVSSSAQPAKTVATLVDMQWPAGELEEQTWRVVAGKFTPPPWVETESCMTTYTSECTSALVQLVEATGKQQKSRQALLLALVAQFGPTIEASIEAEAAGMATFLLQYKMPAASGDMGGGMVSHMLALIVRMPASFPAEAPKFLLASCALQQGGAAAGGGGPLHLVYGAGDYPYSPRWEAAELASRIATFLAETAVPAVKSSIEAALRARGNPR